MQAQFKGMTVLAGVDDMDSFKGIDLKLQVRFVLCKWCALAPRLFRFMQCASILTSQEVAVIWK